MSDDPMMAPWSVCEPGDCPGIDGHFVAVMDADDERFVALVLGGDAVAQQRAKAIAIAPDLLDAARALIEHAPAKMTYRNDVERVAYARMRAALALTDQPSQPADDQGAL